MKPGLQDSTDLCSYFLQQFCKAAMMEIGLYEKNCLIWNIWSILSCKTESESIQTKVGGNVKPKNTELRFRCLIIF